MSKKPDFSDLTPAQARQAAKDLTKARAILTDPKRGWKQNSLGHRHGPVCALGAINTATHGSPVRVMATIAAGTRNFRARTALRRVISTPIPYWNDSRQRTKRQVVGAFTRAINALNKRGAEAK